MECPRPGQNEPGELAAPFPFAVGLKFTWRSRGIQPLIQAAAEAGEMHSRMGDERWGFHWNIKQLGCRT